MALNCKCCHQKRAEARATLDATLLPVWIKVWTMLLTAPNPCLRAMKEPPGSWERKLRKEKCEFVQQWSPRLQIQKPHTTSQMWLSRGRVSPAQPPLSRQPSVGKHTHFLLGLHPHKAYLYFTSRTAFQARFKNHGPLSSLFCAPLPEQGLPNPLIFIMSGCFCSAPLLSPIKNNDLNKVYLNTTCGLLNPFFFEVYRSL